MKTFNERIKNESEPVPKDISSEFLSMNSMEFVVFLGTMREEPSLSITIDWKSVSTARRLKAFLEEGGRHGQKRYATIRATREQSEEEPNVFASGVRWEKV